MFIDLKLMFIADITTSVLAELNIKNTKQTKKSRNSKEQYVSYIVFISTTLGH